MVKKKKIKVLFQTYIFGSKKLHSSGHLVGKTQQVDGCEAFIHVVWQQGVYLRLCFGKHTHHEAFHGFNMCCKNSPLLSDLAFNGRQKLGIIMCALQLSSPCNYKPLPVLNSDKGVPLNQQWLKHNTKANKLKEVNRELQRVPLEPFCEGGWS